MDHPIFRVARRIFTLVSRDDGWEVADFDWPDDFGVDIGGLRLRVINYPTTDPGLEAMFVYHPAHEHSDEEVQLDSLDAAIDWQDKTDLDE